MNKIVKTRIGTFELTPYGVKFNPNHDAAGRFASGGGGAMAPDTGSGGHASSNENIFPGHPGYGTNTGPINDPKDHSGKARKLTDKAVNESAKAYANLFGNPNQFKMNGMLMNAANAEASVYNGNFEQLFHYHGEVSKAHAEMRIYHLSHDHRKAAKAHKIAKESHDAAIEFYKEVQAAGKAD